MKTEKRIRENNEQKHLSVIPVFVKDLGLTPAQTLVLSKILALCRTKRGCFASNACIARDCSCSERTVSRVVGDLKKKGLIEEVCFDGRLRTLKATERLLRMMKAQDCSEAAKRSVPGTADEREARGSGRRGGLDETAGQPGQRGEADKQKRRGGQDNAAGQAGQNGDIDIKTDKETDKETEKKTDQFSPIRSPNGGSRENAERGEERESGEEREEREDWGEREKRKKEKRRRKREPDFVSFDPEDFFRAALEKSKRKAEEISRLKDAERAAKNQSVTDAERAAKNGSGTDD